MPKPVDQMFPGREEADGVGLDTEELDLSEVIEEVPTDLLHEWADNFYVWVDGDAENGPRCPSDKDGEYIASIHDELKRRGE